MAGPDLHHYTTGAELMLLSDGTFPFNYSRRTNSRLPSTSSTSRTFCKGCNLRAKALCNLSEWMHAYWVQVHNLHGGPNLFLSSVWVCAARSSTHIHICTHMHEGNCNSHRWDQITMALNPTYCLDADKTLDTCTWWRPSSHKCALMLIEGFTKHSFDERARSKWHLKAVIAFDSIGSLTNIAIH